MTVLIIMLFITVIAAVVFNSLSIASVVLLFVGTIGLVSFIKHNPLKNNYAVYITLFIVWVGAVFMPSFHLVSANNSNYAEITYVLNNRVLSFGIRVFFISVMSIWVNNALFLKTKPGNIKYYFKPRVVNDLFIHLFLIGSILLSLFCYSIGLGRMGAESVVLPFHLGGIINFFRSLLIPFLFAIFIESYVCNGQSIPKSIWLLFLVWCIIETFAWLSKSIIIRYLLPALILLYIYKKPSIKKIIRIAIPIALVFLFMYPIIEAMRLESGKSIVENYSSARKTTDDSYGLSGVLAPLNRAFMFGSQYVQDIDYINENDIFDFSKLPLIVATGGSARYQTIVIDEFPPTAIHSSGTCGIMDPLLHGGRGLVYIVYLLIVSFASFIDRLISKGFISIAVILIQLLLFLNLNENVSSLYDNNGLPMYLVYGLALFLAYRINYRKKHRVYNEPT